MRFSFGFLYWLLSEVFSTIFYNPYLNGPNIKGNNALSFVSLVNKRNIILFILLKTQTRMTFSHVVVLNTEVFFLIVHKFCPQNCSYIFFGSF